MTKTKFKIRNFFKIAGKAFLSWRKKDPFRQSAVIAYYAIFSIPGLLMLLISIAGYFFGQDEVSSHLMGEITTTLGAETADQVQSMIHKTSEVKISLWAKIIGGITIIIGATGVFNEFQKSLNNIWEVKPLATKSRIKKIVVARLFSFGLILSLAFILMVSLVISAVLNAFGDWISGRFSESALIILQVLTFITSTAILAFLFALMFKYLPDAKIKWNHVWIGALVTALLFELGKTVLEIYFSKTTPEDGYGSGGSVILILLWVSYSSLIVFYGAEFTRAYVALHADPVEPTDIAVKVEKPDER